MKKCLVYACLGWGGLSGLLAGPYLPPVAAERVGTAPSMAPAPPLQEAVDRGGDARPTVQSRRIVREYEQTMFGYTQDQGDASFFDFTASLMFPLPFSYYAEELAQQEWWRPQFFTAATVRGGQYVNSRKSSPVVGKRFNPLISARWWLPAGGLSDQLKNDRFIELVIAHESNGQWIEDEQTFLEAEAVHLANLQRDGYGAGQTDAQLRDLARAETRDEISRGWDYVGLHLRWAANLIEAEKWRDHLTFEAKLQHYVALLQDRLEEYEDWEMAPDGKPRNRVDGVYFKVNYKWDRQPNENSQFHLGTEMSLIWRTGSGAPFQHNTWEFELGGRLLELPLLFWYRTGYNSDFIDYFHRDESYGLKVIVEGF
jgi:hypothetical protein